MGAALDAFGGLHILVNNAAIRGNDALGEMSLETFQAIMRTNVEAPMLCAQAAAPHMAAAGWGRRRRSAGSVGGGGFQFAALFDKK